MRLVVSLALVLMSCTVNAKIYTWVDDNGNVHYGDVAGHSDAVELKLDVGVFDKAISDISEDGGLTREEKRQRLIDVMNEDREEREKLEEEKKEKRKEKKEKCAQLKDKLKNMMLAQGIYNLDKNGNRVFISDKDRNRSENRLKKAIKKNCR